MGIAAAFFTIPVLTLLFFVFSLVSYLNGRRGEKENPGSIGSDELRRRRTWLIVTAVIAAVVWTAVIAFMISLSYAIAHM